MALFEWTDTLSTGVNEMDAQHKQLIAMINELYDALREARSKEVLAGVLSRLHQYTKTHFKAEEAFMQRTSYPGLADQQREHQAFIDRIASAEEEYNSGRSSLGGELLNFLRDWLKHHIIELDKKYGPA
jgi:hemerythrin